MNIKKTPAGWNSVKLGEIAAPGRGAVVSGPFGSNISKKYFVEKGVPVIRGNNLTSGGSKFVDEGFVFVTEAKANELRNCEALTGDVVFTAAGTLGQVGVIPEGAKFPRYIISNKQLRVRCDLDVALPDYVYYWFSSPGMREYVINQNTGASVPLITLGILKSLPLLLPPLLTQRKIAAILGAYDDLIENNLRRIKILEEMAQLIYREWFVNFRFPGHEDVPLVDSPLGRIPERWEVGYFTDVADVLSGGTPKTKVQGYWGGSIPFFTPKDAPDAFYVISTEKPITESGLESCNNKLYGEETVFITARGTVGKVVMPGVPMAMNQSCYALKPRNGLSHLYLFLFTRSYVDYLKKRTGGATFDTIIVDTFKRLQVVKAPVEVTAKFADLVRPFFDEIRNLTFSITNLKSTRDLLLPRLISGEIDVSALDIDVG